MDVELSESGSKTGYAGSVKGDAGHAFAGLEKTGKNRGRNPGLR